uniref:Uncharacterized protein n=1 Tax=Mus spicilegus TaxID=10103 RepID=A0A8C6HG10_MUSSI
MCLTPWCVLNQPSCYIFRQSHFSIGLVAFPGRVKELLIEELYYAHDSIINIIPTSLVVYRRCNTVLSLTFEIIKGCLLLSGTSTTFKS